MTENMVFKPLDKKRYFELIRRKGNETKQLGKENTIFVKRNLEKSLERGKGGISEVTTRRVIVLKQWGKRKRSLEFFAQFNIRKGE